MSGGRGVVGARVVCALVVALFVASGQVAAAQQLYSGTLPDGAASVGADWAELVFPPLG